MELKIREITPGCMPKKIEIGDWIDLYTADSVRLAPGEIRLIKLGIAVDIPEGYEAIVVPRSSTCLKHGIIQANSIGVIDNSYSGDNDEWGFPAYATRFVSIPKGTRLCQFRLLKNQPELDLIKVDSLGNKNRGGWGSTGE